MGLGPTCKVQVRPTEPNSLATNESIRRIPDRIQDYSLNSGVLGAWGSLRTFGFGWASFQSLQFQELPDVNVKPSLAQFVVVQGCGLQKNPRATRFRAITLTIL